MEHTKYEIAVLGTRTPLGSEILAELDRQNYPSDLIHPLDLHQEAGNTILYHHQTLSSLALDLFDFAKPYVLFLCDPRIVERSPQRFIRGHNWLIDCTGTLAQAACIVPDLNGQDIFCLKHRILCAPHSVVIALARALSSLERACPIEQVQATAVLGAWYTQPLQTEALIQQTRHCFTQTPIAPPNTYPVLAFNLIPDFFKGLLPLIDRQLKCFLSTPIQLSTCFAPVIRGGLFHLNIHMAHSLPLKQIRSLFQQNSVCQLLDSSHPIGTLDLLTEEKLYIQHVRVLQNIVSFWLMQDPVQTGFIQNAVRILSLLIK